jgi:acyl-CoA reductase-like NAD-dependent aldehyde dehydrogenase
MLRIIYAKGILGPMSPRPVIRKHNPATLELMGEAEAVLPEDVPNMVDLARQAQVKWAS